MRMCRGRLSRQECDCFLSKHTAVSIPEAGPCYYWKHFTSYGVTREYTKQQTVVLVTAGDGHHVGFFVASGPFEGRPVVHFGHHSCIVTYTTVFDMLKLASFVKSALGASKVSQSGGIPTQVWGVTTPDMEAIKADIVRYALDNSAGHCLEAASEHLMMKSTMPPYSLLLSILFGNRKITECNPGVFECDMDALIGNNGFSFQAHVHHTTRLISQHPLLDDRPIRVPVPNPYRHKPCVDLAFLIAKRLVVLRGRTFTIDIDTLHQIYGYLNGKKTLLVQHLLFLVVKTFASHPAIQEIVTLLRMRGIHRDDEIPERRGFVTASDIFTAENPSAPRVMSSWCVDGKQRASIFSLDTAPACITNAIRDIKLSDMSRLDLAATLWHIQRYFPGSATTAIVPQIAKMMGESSLNNVPHRIRDTVSRINSELKKPHTKYESAPFPCLHRDKSTGIKCAYSSPAECRNHRSYADTSVQALSIPDVWSLSIPKIKEDEEDADILAAYSDFVEGETSKHTLLPAIYPSKRAKIEEDDEDDDDEFLIGAYDSLMKLSP